MRRIGLHQGRETIARKLLTREQAARVLGGIHVDTVRRLELKGQLKPIRLSKAETARVYYRVSEVEALAEEGFRDDIP